MDGEVFQLFLFLFVGFGEVLCIGEVILNFYFGLCFKFGVVIIDMFMVYDKFIDFGLQNFCENCNKCVCECFLGVIIVGLKLMFNGYEIWKFDSQKCVIYWIIIPGGVMCGCCMKICFWNFEGFFVEVFFCWVVFNIFFVVLMFVKFDDCMKCGGLNDIKKWWWDLKFGEDGGYYLMDEFVNCCDLQIDLDLKYEDQMLVVYFVMFVLYLYFYFFLMDCEVGIKVYEVMILVEDYKVKIVQGEIVYIYCFFIDVDSFVVMVKIVMVEKMILDVIKYVFIVFDGSFLFEWIVGVYLDVVVVLEFLC